MECKLCEPQQRIKYLVLFNCCRISTVAGRANTQEQFLIQHPCRPKSHCDYTTSHPLLLLVAFSPTSGMNLIRIQDSFFLSCTLHFERLHKSGLIWCPKRSLNSTNNPSLTSTCTSRTRLPSDTHN